MSNEIVKSIVYILAFLLSDLLGYKLVSVNTTSKEVIDFKTNTSSIKFVTSTIEANGEIKIEIKTPSSTIIATSSLENLSSKVTSSDLFKAFNLSTTKEK